MTKLISLALFIIPGKLNIAIRRFILNQDVSWKCNIQIFTLLLCKKLKIEDNAKISAFSFLKCNKIVLHKNSQISNFNIIFSDIIDNANFELGAHSKIFPFCWIEPGEGVLIGKNVGIGGYSLIFTHSSWSNYLLGGPVKFGKVEIGDNTWLPWRVFILPQVRIGENVIIGANSTISKDVPSNSLYAGNPAKFIKTLNLNSTDVYLERLDTLWEEYSIYKKRCSSLFNEFNRHNVQFIFDNNQILPEQKIIINLKKMTYFANCNTNETVFFISFLRRFGIRLDNVK